MEVTDADSDTDACLKMQKFSLLVGKTLLQYIRANLES
jgi:hypothetical protein